MTREAVSRLVAETGLHPSQAQVVELHDCFSANELISYEALGLCPEGVSYLSFTQSVFQSPTKV